MAPLLISKGDKMPKEEKSLSTREKILQTGMWKPANAPNPEIFKELAPIYFANLAKNSNELTAFGLAPLVGTYRNVLDGLNANELQATMATFKVQQRNLQFDDYLQLLIDVAPTEKDTVTNFETEYQEQIAPYMQKPVIDILTDKEAKEMHQNIGGIEAKLGIYAQASLIPLAFPKKG